MPLTDVEVRSARPRDKAYRLTDGLGMYLEVSPAGGKYWRFKYAGGSVAAAAVEPEYADLKGNGTRKEAFEGEVVRYHDFSMAGDRRNRRGP